MPQPRVQTYVLAFAAVTATIAIGGCGFIAAGDKSSVKPSVFVMTGSAAVTLPAGGSAAPGTACTAPVGVSDVAKDATVTVTVPSGLKIATGRLGAGVVTADGSICSFPFQIRAVEGGYSTYGVAIGDRPAQNFAEGPLRANEPAVLTITPSATP